VWRHHAVFITSPFQMLQAEADHRGHAIIEQVIADGKGSALAHLPSSSFSSNAAWATLRAIAHNLTRAAGILAGTFHAKATTATIRAHLVNVPARLARRARRLTLHLPQRWPWQAAFEQLHAAVGALLIRPSCPARPPPSRPDQGPTKDHSGYSRTDRQAKPARNRPHRNKINNAVPEDHRLRVGGSELL
jgi:hypothetical protein